LAFPQFFFDHCYFVVGISPILLRSLLFVFISFMNPFFFHFVGNRIYLKFFLGGSGSGSCSCSRAVKVVVVMAVLQFIPVTKVIYYVNLFSILFVYIVSSCFLQLHLCTLQTTILNGGSLGDTGTIRIITIGTNDGFGWKTRHETKGYCNGRIRRLHNQGG